MGSLAGFPTVNYASSLLNSNSQNNSNLKIFIFSKHLQFLNYKEMSEAAKEMGFDGIDLTVRPQGHVLPERVADDLPKATETMKSFGLLIEMLTTKVNDAADPVTRKVLEVVSQQGYRFYRPAWFRYDLDKNISEQTFMFREKFTALAQLNKELGISGSYHNHSGNFMGASIWDLYNALEGILPEQRGSQYDIMHATVEGGKNWEIGLNLIKDEINTLVVKDFKWGKVEGKWKTVHVPMGEGMVDFKKYFSLLKKYGINVPLSIHYEYDLGGAEHGQKPTIDKKEVFKKMKKDLMFVKKMWQNSN